MKKNTEEEMKKCKMRWKKPGEGKTVDDENQAEACGGRGFCWWLEQGEGVEHNNQPGNLGMGTGNLGKPGLTEAIFCIALLCLQIQTFFGSLGFCSLFLGHLLIH